MADEEKKTGEIATERLLSVAKKNIVNRLNSGKDIPVRDLEYLVELEKRLKDIKSPPHEKTAPLGDAEAGDTGIPARLRIPRYTLSAAALGQRKKAAKSDKKSEAMKGNKNSWKHGKYAKGFIERFIRPCKSTCKSYPCELIESGEAKPGGACLDKTEMLTTFAALKKALTEKKNPERYDDINEIISMKVAGAMQVVEMLIEDVITDNTIVKSEKFDSEGKVIGYEIKPHPSLFSLSKLLHDLGITLHDLHITPKALAKSGEVEEAGETFAKIIAAAGKMRGKSAGD